MIHRGRGFRIDVARLLCGVFFAFAAIACAAATWSSLSNDDAFTAVVAVDLLTIPAFLLSAFIARSLLGTGAAILTVAFSLFDAFLRLLSTAIGTDSPHPVSALTFFGAGAPSFYPLLGFLLIVAMGFALRRRVRLAWIGSCIIAVIAGILCILGRDPSMLAGVWYLTVAVDLIRPGRAPLAAAILAVLIATASSVSAHPNAGPWIGNWVAQTRENQQSLTIELRGGKLHITGTAIWYDRYEAAKGLVPSGYFTTIVATPKSNRVNLAPGDTPGCTVQLRLSGATLLAHDDGACGGMNVTFTGVYRRR